MATSADSGRSGSGRPGGDDRILEPVAARRRQGSAHRTRAFLSALLITLAVLLAPLSAVAVWVADVIGDSDRYVATVAPLASNPDVQKATTDLVTNAVMSNVDLDSVLAAVPSDERPAVESALRGLSGPINSGLRNFVHGTVGTFVASDDFAAIWKQLNRNAHAAFTGALTGKDDEAIQLRGDEVVLNLAPVVEQVKQRLVYGGLAIASRIPPVRTEFTLVKSEQLRNARTWFRALQVAGNWLPVVTVVLAGAGVLLAKRRRRALVAAALGITVTVAALAIALGVFRTVYLDHLPAGTNEQAAGAIYDQIVRFLRVSVRTAIVLGALVAIGGWLSGSGRLAQRVRTLWESVIAAVREALGITSTGRFGAWVHRFGRLLRWGAVVVAAAVLLVWSYPTGWVVLWIALVLLGTLAVIEFFDDRTGRRRGRVITA